MPERNCKKITDKDGDYLLSVKGNQGKLHKAIEY
jgi:predicted transposase YbfD/YdcC